MRGGAGRLCAQEFRAVADLKSGEAYKVHLTFRYVDLLLEGSSHSYFCSRESKADNLSYVK